MLSQDALDELGRQAEADLSRRLVEEEERRVWAALDEISPEHRSHTVLSNLVEIMGSDIESLPCDVFEAVLRAEMGYSGDELMPGFWKYEDKLRQRACERSYVADAGLIPPEQVFSYRLH